jgi:hypothetical protein
VILKEIKKKTILPFHKEKLRKHELNIPFRKNYLALEAGGCVLLVAGLIMLVFQDCRSSIYLQATHTGLHMLLNLQLAVYICFTDIHSFNTSVHMSLSPFAVIMSRM